MLKDYTEEIERYYADTRYNINNAYTASRDMEDVLLEEFSCHMDEADDMRDMAYMQILNQAVEINKECMNVKRKLWIIHSLQQKLSDL